MLFGYKDSNLLGCNSLWFSRTTFRRNASNLRRQSVAVYFLICTFRSWSWSREFSPKRRWTSTLQPRRFTAVSDSNRILLQSVFDNGNKSRHIGYHAEHTWLLIQEVAYSRLSRSIKHILTRSILTCVQIVRGLNKERSQGGSVLLCHSAQRVILK